MRFFTGIRNLLRKPAWLFVAAAVIVYLSSFFCSRKTVVLDYLSIDGRRKGYHVRTYYFSRSANTNIVLWRVYYPLFAPFSDNESILDSIERGLAITSNGPIYVRELDSTSVTSMRRARIF